MKVILRTDATISLNITITYGSKFAAFWEGHTNQGRGIFFVPLALGKPIFNNNQNEELRKKL